MRRRRVNEDCAEKVVAAPLRLLPAERRKQHGLATSDASYGETPTPQKLRAPALKIGQKLPMGLLKMHAKLRSMPAQSAPAQSAPAQSAPAQSAPAKRGRDDDDDDDDDVVEEIRLDDPPEVIDVDVYVGDEAVVDIDDEDVEDIVAQVLNLQLLTKEDEEDEGDDPPDDENDDDHSDDEEDDDE